MKEFFNNKYTVVVLGGLILTIILKYVAPILPDKIIWKELLSYMTTLLMYGFIIWNYFNINKNIPFSKTYVMVIILNSLLLILFITTDVLYYLKDIGFFLNSSN
ncbi:MAG: hypothetical protein L3J34_06580 [Flavobacteriaceae bacterium]|nr:hypothetical protein [Flavobacteriaceae bacterium]